MHSSGTALLDAYKLLKLTGVHSGDRIADFGVGHSGHLAFPAAVAVGEDGLVYGVDIQKNHIHALEHTRQAHALHHVHFVWADIEEHSGLADASVDVVFLVDMLRVVKKLKNVINEARRVLTPRGRIIVVDWQPETTHPVAPPKSSRTSARDSDLQFLQCGCAVLGRLDASPWHWGRIYEAR